VSCSCPPCRDDSSSEGSRSLLPVAFVMKYPSGFHGWAVWAPLPDCDAFIMPREGIAQLYTAPNNTGLGSVSGFRWDNSLANQTWFLFNRFWI